jgi:FixJ family two-component response regulator
VILAPIPVFVISATANKENTHGAVGFIKKPANLEVVLKMVESHCKKNT